MELPDPTTGVLLTCCAIQVTADAVSRVIHLPNGGDDQMDKLGYTKVDDPAVADVHVLPAVNVRDYTGYAYTGGWWNYWYGYYPPYWGWYPYYPGYGVSYDYSIGTLFILMIDPSQPVVGDKVPPPIWIAGINGLVDKSTNAKRIENGIKQAFAQSKYLGEGK